MTDLENVIKRSFDIIAAAAALACFSPAMAAIAVAVRLDSAGPAIFRQARLGRLGRPFQMLKFRTMKQSAGVAIDPSGMVLNSQHDARHTRVGRILRKYSLDELPQLMNVLKGEMSIIGPRPDLPEALSLYSPRQRSKLRSRPGITGLAQISGRNKLGAQAKWDLDADYAEHSSLSLDASVLFRTFLRVVEAEDIYPESR